MNYTNRMYAFMKREEDIGGFGITKFITLREFQNGSNDVYEIYVDDIIVDSFFASLKSSVSLFYEIVGRLAIKGWVVYSASDYESLDNGTER